MSAASVSFVIKKYSYWSKRTGIRWQLLLTLLVLWLAGFWLRNEYGGEDTNLWLVMNLLIRLAQWTIIALISVSILSAFISWGHFLLNVRHKKIAVQAKFGDGQKAEAGWVQTALLLKGLVLRPLLGTVQGTFVFSDKQVSETLILDENIRKPRSLWRQAIRGQGKTFLHDRGIYDVEHILISHYDMLGLLSLPCLIPFNSQLFTLPQKQKEKEVKAHPNAVEEQKYRIEVPRRVEGEYVNYKEFESGDNIRRIVWKIYAKSGQLVVRIPETKDPYASHLYFYTSYFHGLGLQDGAFEKELLNVYKDQVRNLFEALEKNGYDVRMPSDQEVPNLSGVDVKKNSLFQITAASWQLQLPPSKFVSPSKAAFVCLPSLTPKSEVETIFKNLHASVPVVIIRLSNAIPSPFQFGLKDIFVSPVKKPADKLRQPWLLAPLRRALISNEKQITDLIRMRENSWIVDVIDFRNEREVFHG